MRYPVVGNLLTYLNYSVVMLALYQLITCPHAVAYSGFIEGCLGTCISKDVTPTGSFKPTNCFIRTRVAERRHRAVLAVAAGLR